MLLLEKKLYSLVRVNKLFECFRITLKIYFQDDSDPFKLIHQDGGLFCDVKVSAISAVSARV